MKKRFLQFLSLVLVLSLSLFFTACPTEPQVTEDPVTEDPAEDDPVLVGFSGGVFKGPFLVGSTVTIYELDASLNQTGKSYSGDIVSDDGTYDISGLDISGPVELVANGYYYNELTGQITADQMTMRAITEQTGVVNINLFTALEYDRVKALYNAGSTISQAKAQAIGEIFTAFGLSKYQDDSGEISVSSANGAELLLVSALMSYKYSNVATLQNAITTMRVDLADGVIDVSNLTENARYINAAGVKSNLTTYYANKNLDVTVPGFSDELWNMYGTDTLEPDTGNYLKLESAGVVELIAGYGHLDGFIIPEGYTLSFEINLPVENNYSRFFTYQDGPSFTVPNNKFATVTGPGYFRLDFMVSYPTTPYEFTITANNNGDENTVTYRVIDG